LQCGLSAGSSASSHNQRKAGQGNEAVGHAGARRRCDPWRHESRRAGRHAGPPGREARVGSSRPSQPRSRGARYVSCAAPADSP
jgi:hypothetical protein